MIRVVQTPGECYIFGTSAETKPTPTSGYAFFEVDTAKCFLGNGSAWVESTNPAYQAAGAGGGVAAWGTITGLMSAQLDLSAALAGKAASSHTHSPSEVTGTAVVDADARLTNNRKPGFVAGDGGTVTQLTSKATGVTLNKLCGRITTHNAALAAAAEVKFTVTNSTVSATDVVVVNIQSGGTSGSYFVVVGAVANGSFDIVIGNCSARSLSQALVISFAVVKSVIA